MLVLGIETSCDETAAAVVDADGRILSNIVRSQIALHQPYGGVVPEIAARAHVEQADLIIAEAMREAGVGFAELSAVAATGGPGLIGGVIVGVMSGKAIASVHHKPFIAVNHLEGHALTARLTDDVPFPFLLLLVSGGHCLMLAVKGVGDYERLGGTLDDALGEAYDKTAKMLGLPYPGGPQVEALARGGDETRFAFPLSMVGKPGCDFSFSGLKTAVRRQKTALEEAKALNEGAMADLCASFQYTVARIVEDRLNHAIALYRAKHDGPRLVVAGGVAANQYLRTTLEATAHAHGFTLTMPPPALCTDNAAMIAWAGLERFRLGLVNDLHFEPRARWPLAAA